MVEKSRPLTRDQRKALEQLIKERRFVGRDYLWKLTRKKYPNLKITRRQVMAFIREIETHKINAPKKRTKHIGRTYISGRNVVIAIDLIDMRKREDRGYKWIFTSIDMWSRKTWVEAMKDKTDMTVSYALREILKKVRNDNNGRNPKRIRSDNDSSFKSHIFINEMTI